jgi:hypothetical protein
MTSDTRAQSFRVWGTAGGSLIRLNPLTGAGTVVGAYNLAGSSVSTLAFDSTAGKLYGTDGISKLYSIDPETAAATLVGTSPTAVPHNSLGFDNSGRLFMMAPNDPGDLYRIDTTSGAFNLVAHTSIPTSLQAPLIDLATRPEDGVTFGVLNIGSFPAEFYTIDLNTGASSKIGSVGPLGSKPSIFGLAFSPAVPEPTSLSLLAIATALASFRIRPARCARSLCSAFFER